MTKEVAIVGPTASGKTRRAVSIARALHSEIISADSRQVYRGMTIGTGKDLEEYGEVPFHLVDVAAAGDKYDLHRYVTDFRRVEKDILSRGLVPVICGGSGMYVETVLAGVTLPDVPENPGLRKELAAYTLEELTARLAAMKQLHNTTDVDTVKRAIRAIEIETYYREHPEQAALADRSRTRQADALIIGVDIDRDSRRRRISERLQSRLEEGMVDEVKSLLDSGISPEDLIYYGLEYKFITLYVIGELSYDEMYKGLETAIHQFAKRQMTWFRGMERRGFTIHWLPYDLPEQDFVGRVLELMQPA